MTHHSKRCVIVQKFFLAFRYDGEVEEMGGSRVEAADEIACAHVSTFRQTDEGGVMGADLTIDAGIVCVVLLRPVDQQYHVGSLGNLTAAPHS